MSLFSRKAEPMPEAPKGGGLTYLRGRARALSRTPQAQSWLKDDLRVTADELDRFLNGGTLPLPKIELLIRTLGLKAVYDAERDLLISTAAPATPVGNFRPEPFAAKPFVPPGEAVGVGCYAPKLFPRSDVAPVRKPPVGWA